MSTRLVVDSEAGLTEMSVREPAPYPFAIRLIAKVVSYVFHPVFVPVYIACFLVLVQPFLVSGSTTPQKVLVVARFFVMYSFFPLVTVLLAKALGFVDSIYLRTQRDRIIPYITSMIYYFWMWYVLRNQPEFSPRVVALTFAIFFASIIGLMSNIYIKISMHAMAMGILVAFMVSLALGQPDDFGLYISGAFLIAGLVCTSRLLVSDHTPREIYLGFLAGIAAQLVGELTRGLLY